MTKMTESRTHWNSLNEFENPKGNGNKHFSLVRLRDYMFQDLLSVWTLRCFISSLEFPIVLYDRIGVQV